jgi:uncharacterized protein (TIGR04255 family)
MTTDNHTSYIRAPIALVVTEIRFPGELGSAISTGVQRAFREAFGDDWIVELPQQPTLSVNLNNPSWMPPSIVSGPAQYPPGAILRLTLRDRTAAVALTAGTVSVETTNYANWPGFRAILEKAIGATTELLRPEGITRVGVRYIDEVRVGDSPDWLKWLSPDVQAPCAAQMVEYGWSPIAWNGMAQYGIGDDRQLVLRYAPQAQPPGFIVDPAGPLRRVGPPPAGPFFILDFDAFWQPSAIPSWIGDALLEACDQLRRPIRALFDQIITDHLVTEVFNNDREGERQ